jgi:predicted Zn-dependent peptidase
MKVPEVIKLKNGLRVCIIPRTCVDSVTIHLKGLVGSNYENLSEIGAAHLLEHLNLLKGNRNKILVNGGKVLGVTSRDDVLYMVKVLKENVLDGVEFISHIFDKNTFSDEDLQVQKKIIVQEIKRAQGRPEKILNTASFKNLYPKDRMSIKNIGYEHNVRVLDKKVLNIFQEKYYSPNNFVLVLCGNVKKDAILPYVDKLFKKFQKGKTLGHIKHDVDARKREQTVKPNYLKDGHVKIDFYGFVASDYRKYPLMILTSVYDTLLKNLFKDKLGYVYIISCVYFPFGSYGSFSVVYSCESKNVHIIKSMVLELLNDYRKILSSRNVEHVKKKVIADFTFRFEKISQIAEYYSDILLHGSGNQNHLSELNAIKKLNSEDVINVASEILKQEAKITILTG